MVQESSLVLNNVGPSTSILWAESEHFPGILVRNESARDELRAMIGDIGLIM